MNWTEGRAVIKRENILSANLEVIFLLFISTIVVSFYRFGDSENFIDSTLYVEIANFFRGNAQLNDLNPPFSFRPLVPFTVSLLPFSIPTGFGIVNTLFIFLSSLVLFAFLKELQFSKKFSLIGSLLFIFSFPTFWYGSACLTDATGIFFMLVGVYLIKKNYPLISIVFATSLGVLAREMVIVLLPLYMLCDAKRSFRKLFLFAIPLIVLSLVRIYFSPKVGVHSWYWFHISWDFVLFNLTRVDMWVTLILTLGIFPFLIIVGYLKDTWTANIDKEDLILLKNIFISFSIIPGYAFTAAYFDGRYIWVLYPVLIPLSLLGLPWLLSRFKTIISSS